ncbi:hypothetical protein [Endothiovibrio diazotrophicus]
MTAFAARLIAVLMLAQFALLPSVQAGEAAGPGVTQLFSEIIAQAPTPSDRRAAACQPFSATIPGAYGGTASTSGELCVNTETQYLEMSSLLAYASYSSVAGVTIDGSVAVVIAIQGETQLAIAFHGGPLTYTIGGETHTVSFDSVAVGYDMSSGSLQATQVTGTITVDGVAIPMELALAPYLL